MSSIIRAVEAVKAVRVQRLRGKTTVNHMNTRTTQLTNEIADNAKLQLEKITNQMDKMIAKNPNITVAELQDIFKVHIGTIIAEAVRNSYLLGFKFIEEFAGRTIRLSPQNLFQIDTQIEKNTTSFWNNIQKILQEQRQQRFTTFYGAAGEEKILAKLVGFLNSVAVSMSFASLNQGTITARMQQYNEEILSGRVSANIPRLSDPTLNTRPEFNPPTSSGLAQPVPPLLIWVSERDSRVCPICLNLDGRTFDANDPDIPTPGPDGTHWGCRCRLLPEMDGKVFNG